MFKIFHAKENEFILIKTPWQKQNDSNSYKFRLTKNKNSQMKV